MADYTHIQCLQCKRTDLVRGVHCMGCSLHARGPAMHMHCSRCNSNWYIEIPEKKEEKKKKKEP